MMHASIRVGARALVACLLLSIAACEVGDGGAGGDPWTALEGWPRHEEEAIRVTGTVDEIGVEGGVWVIRAPGGEEWAPIELPEAFRIEGAGVVADVRRRPDLLSIGMRGSLVEVLRIRHGSVPEADDAALAGDAGIEAATSPAAGTAAEAPARLVGEWRIVDAHLPGVSTGAAAAERWFGRTIQYGRTFAFGPNGECSTATFETRRADVDGLLSGGYGIPRESLPPLAEADEVIVAEVRCGGATWDALGGTVLLLDDGRALTPLDGAFLSLERVDAP